MRKGRGLQPKLTQSVNQILFRGWGQPLKISHMVHKHSQPMIPRIPKPQTNEIKYVLELTKMQEVVSSTHSHPKAGGGGRGGLGMQKDPQSIILFNSPKREYRENAAASITLTSPVAEHWFQDALWASGTKK